MQLKNSTLADHIGLYFTTAGKRVSIRHYIRHFLTQHIFEQERQGCRPLFTRNTRLFNLISLIKL
ncbi:Uncharacterised protein [Vibrio cholerae]|nr:Uncharacterised protein [Vibrio cholerae]CSB78192.1 Uncharacterised protein [Vibrio cholerae]